MKFAILISALLLSASVNAQLPPHVSRTPISSSVSGTVRSTNHSFFHHWQHGEWRHFKVKLPRNSNPKLSVVWLEDIDHPISSPGRPGDPNWQKYDPRNVAVRAGALTFDAVAGDRIAYSVGWRQAN